MSLSTVVKVIRKASKRVGIQEGSLDLGWDRKPQKGEDADWNLREKA